jgi:hypothetical protein
LLVGISTDVLAAGKDILAGTDTDLLATLNGSGKKYVYLIEMIMAIAGYMKTKNVFILGGILVVSVAFNAMIKIYNGA